MTADNIKNYTDRKRKEKAVTTVTKHVEKYLTTISNTSNERRLHRFTKRVVIDARLILLGLEVRRYGTGMV